MCSTGPGGGALLLYKLCSYLEQLSCPATLQVCMDKCKEAAGNFYVKMGFKSRSTRLAVGDVLYLNVQEGLWKEHTKARTNVSTEMLGEMDSTPVNAEEDLLRHYWPSAVQVAKPEVIKYGDGATYFGERHAVCGNGSCWMYAFMTAIGVCEHANPCQLDGAQMEKRPTPRDYTVSELICRKMKETVHTMRMGPRSVEFMEQVTVATRSTPGTYGGVDQFSILSHLFECTIVIVDQGRPDHIVVCTGSARGTARTYKRSDLHRLMKDAVDNKVEVAVVESNGSYDAAGHFSAYSSQNHCMPEHPVWLKRVLTK